MNNIRENKDFIIIQITEEYEFMNYNYILSGIVCWPFNGIILVLLIYLITKLFYDDCKNNHCFVKINNIKNQLKEDCPYI